MLNLLKRIMGIAKDRDKPGSEKLPSEPEKMAASVGDSDMPVPPPIRERLDCLKTLTPREWEVFEHLICGRKPKEIATLLGVTYPTVNFHCKGLYKKLCINTRTQLFLQYATLDAGDVKKARDGKL